MLCRALLCPGEAYAADKRVALVIGNSGYQNVTKLPNPVNDAAAVATLLKNAGFQTVESRNDMSNVELRRAIREFAVTARDADIAVVYFAGHGIEVDGVNYLIPVDASLQQDVDVEDETVSLDRILKVLEPVKRLRLVILDACRDNPFAKTMKRTMSSRAIGRGLAKVEVTMSDTLIAYAAKAGSTALDGDGANSPFTTALVKHIAEPGLDLRLAFGKVRDDVLNRTGNKQEPFVYGSLGGADISLAPLRRRFSNSIDRKARPECRYEPRLRIRSPDRHAAGVGSFLATYPKGLHADLARAAREKIVAAEKAAATAETAKARAENAEKAQAASAAAERAKAEAARVAAESAERAKQDAAEKARTEASKNQLAALATNAPDPKDIAKNLQSELRRVGCYTGTVDGNWNVASQRSIENFNKYSGMKVVTQSANVDALEAIKTKASRICPIICETGFRADGERCVAIICPSGEKLGGGGKCQKEAPKTATRSLPPAKDAQIVRSALPEAETQLWGRWLRRSEGWMS